MKRKYTKKDSKNNIIIIIAAGAGGGLLLLILLAVLASVCLKRSRRKKDSNKEFRMGSLKRKSEAFEEVDKHGYDVPGHDNPLYASADLKAAQSSFEKLNVKLFPRDELMFLNDLGEGAFGKVSFMRGQT